MNKINQNLGKITQLLFLMVLLSPWTKTFANTDELVLDNVDKKLFLLGMAEMPRVKASKNESINDLFSYFVFNNKVSAETFVNIAK